MAHRMKNKNTTNALDRGSKKYWLPMPRRNSQSIILQCRIALEALRHDRGSLIEAQCLAHAVILTSMLSQQGFGKLDPAVIEGAEEDILAMLERGGSTGEWHFPPAGFARLVDVVNEHDRQLREVRLSALIVCNDRLQGFIESIMRNPPARGD